MWHDGSGVRVGSTAPAEAVRTRVASIDVLRGIAMILMALDHTRDYFGDAAANPVNLARTTAPLFFTRWMTHICAPAFFFLTGTGAYFAGRRRGRAGLSRLLVTRGFWLIALEFTVMRFFLQFNVDYRVTILTVFWAIGWSMVALGALVWLPIGAVTGVGLVMIAAHNLLDPVRPAALGAFAPLWTALHVPGILTSDPRHVVFAAYPLIPWIGVTAVGYGLGPAFEWDRARRRAVLLRTGIAATALFVLLRLVNGYGDPQPWAVQASTLRTIVAFLNATKYPPSLLFLLMTLGASLLILYATDRGTPRALRAANVFGRVPFFYFVLHILLIHLAALAACYVRYGSVHWMFESPTLAAYPVTQPAGWPASLPIVYLIWIGVVVALYPLCRWYAEVRRRSSSPWLSYL